MKTKLKEVVSREEALKTKLATFKNFAKTLHEEIERLNKEFDLFKVTTQKAKEKLKSDLNKAEAKILKPHEDNFFKDTCQAKYFFKEPTHPIAQSNCS